MAEVSFLHISLYRKWSSRVCVCVVIVMNSTLHGGIQRLFTNMYQVYYHFLSLQVFDYLQLLVVEITAPSKQHCCRDVLYRRNGDVEPPQHLTCDFGFVIWSTSWLLPPVSLPLPAGWYEPVLGLSLYVNVTTPVTGVLSICASHEINTVLISRNTNLSEYTAGYFQF